MFLVGFVQSRNTKAEKLLMSLIYSGSGYILIVDLFYKVLYFLQQKHCRLNRVFWNREKFPKHLKRHLNFLNHSGKLVTSSFKLSFQETSMQSCVVG